MRTRRLAVRVTGPLAGTAPGFSAELARRGYTELSTGSQLRLLAHLSRWLASQGAGIEELSPTMLARFVAARRAAGYTGLRSARALVPLLGYLRDLGVLGNAADVRPEGPAADLLARYRSHLVEERGLVPGTISNYLRVARLLFSQRETENGVDLEGLCGAEVMRFAVRECRVRNVGAAKNFITGLRSLLRFLQLEGRVGPLAAAVPTVAGWSGSGLPRALPPTQVTSLLAGCSADTVSGRRDLAILTLLARLGLRAHEVAVLSLDDVHWQRGEVVIRGKGRRDERLPLPVDVGEVITAYVLHGRPKTTSRRLFLGARAPFAELTSGAITQVVRHAGRRAGLQEVGAHRLRHSAATEMLRAGVSLADVSQVLRHRSLATTAIYAKVDRAALRTLVQPWPEEAS
jgi:integrase/recombinase XerD